MAPNPDLMAAGCNRSHYPAKEVSINKPRTWKLQTRNLEPETWNL